MAKPYNTNSEVISVSILMSLETSFTNLTVIAGIEGHTERREKLNEVGRLINAAKTRMADYMADGPFPTEHAIMQDFLRVAHETKEELRKRSGKKVH